MSYTPSRLPLFIVCALAIAGGAVAIDRLLLRDRAPAGALGGITMGGDVNILTGDEAREAFVKKNQERTRQAKERREQDEAVAIEREYHRTAAIFERFMAIDDGELQRFKNIAKDRRSYASDEMGEEVFKVCGARWDDGKLHYAVAGFTGTEAKILLNLNGKYYVFENATRFQDNLLGPDLDMNIIDIFSPDKFEDGLELKVRVKYNRTVSGKSIEDFELGPMECGI